MSYSEHEYDSSSGRKIRDLIMGTDTTYAYTDEGRLESATSDNPAEVRRYGYDAAGQITEAAGVSMSYSSGVLSSSTAGGVVTTHTFDSRGRRTGSSNSSERATYVWSAGDHLSSYTLDRAPFGSTDVAAAFSYDASGQRTRSVVTSAGITTTTDYVYQGLQLLRLVATAGSDVTTISYLYDERGHADALAIAWTGNPKPEIYPIWTTDRGDVGFVGTRDSSALASWIYDPYGRPLTSSTGAGQAAPRIAASQALRYAGYVYDTCSGLYYCSQRYYDPVTCQFISRDPALSDAEESSYQYCDGDPVGNSDPSGLWNRKVHYNKTVRWAMDVGFSAQRARMIAFADTRTDLALHAKDMGNFHGKRGYEGVRKTRMRMAKAAWARGDELDAMTQGGIALHTAQDHSAHVGRDPKYVHKRKGIEPPVGCDIDSWDDAQSGTLSALVTATMRLLTELRSDTVLAGRVGYKPHFGR